MRRPAEHQHSGPVAGHENGGLDTSSDTRKVSGRKRKRLSSQNSDAGVTFTSAKIRLKLRSGLPASSFVSGDQIPPKANGSVIITAPAGRSDSLRPSLALPSLSVGPRGFTSHDANSRVVITPGTHPAHKKKLIEAKEVILDLELRAENERIKKQVAELTSANENLKRLNVSSSVALKIVADILSRLQASHARTEERISTLEKVRDEARDELASAKTALAQGQKTNRELKLEVASMISAKERVKERLSVQKGRFADLQSSSMRWEAACKSSSKSLNTAETKILSLEKALSDGEERTRDLTAKLTAVSRAKKERDEEFESLSDLHKKTKKMHARSQAMLENTSKDFVTFKSLLVKEQLSRKSDLENFQSQETHLKHLLDQAEQKVRDAEVQHLEQLAKLEEEQSGKLLNIGEELSQAGQKVRHAELQHLEQISKVKEKHSGRLHNLGEEAEQKVRDSKLRSLKEIKVEEEHSEELFELGEKLRHSRREEIEKAMSSLTTYMRNLPQMMNDRSTLIKQIQTKPSCSRRDEVQAHPRSGWDVTANLTAEERVKDKQKEKFKSLSNLHEQTQGDAMLVQRPQARSSYSANHP